jgi:hypothetical protein
MQRFEILVFPNSCRFRAAQPVRESVAQSDNGFVAFAL